MLLADCLSDSMAESQLSIGIHGIRIIQQPQQPVGNHKIYGRMQGDGHQCIEPRCKRVAS